MGLRFALPYQVKSGTGLAKPDPTRPVDNPNGNQCVRTYVFHMLRIYVMILCNWLILWQNALFLYLGRLRMCLTTSRNHVLRSSVEAFKSIQEIKQGVQNH